MNLLRSDEAARRPAVAGLFYPAEPRALRSQITAYLDARHGRRLPRARGADGCGHRGYMRAAPAMEFYARMDAANIDLKGFTEQFYFQQTGAHLVPVLDTLQYVRHETSCWLEITTLLPTSADVFVYVHTSFGSNKSCAPLKYAVQP